MENKPAAVLEHLINKLPDYDIMPWTENQSWTPAGIYSVVLRSMKVNEDKIKELYNLIPLWSKTLIEAILISADFS